MANLADPLMGLIDGFAKVAENALVVKGIILAITTAMVSQAAFKAAATLTQLQLNRQLLKSEVQRTGVQSVGAGAKIMGAMATNPITAIVGVGVALAAIAGLMGLLSSAENGNDVMSPGANTSRYGSRTLLGPEGAISLNNKDTVIAGTNLFPKGDDVVSSPAGTIQIPDNSEAKRTNALLEALINKPAPRIQMDSIEVGTVAGMSAFSIQ